MTLPDILSVILGAAAFAVFPIVFLQIQSAWESRREAKRTRAMQELDQSHRRAELEEVRAALESRIYELEGRLTANETRFTDVNHLVLDGNRNKSDLDLSSTNTISRALRRLGVDTDGFKVDDRKVMVLMPFHPDYQWALEALVRAGRTLGLQVLRGDETSADGPILAHVLQHVVESRVIFALLDGRNPNVFYELGIAHLLGKPTILLASSGSDVPFDVQGARVVFFDGADDLEQKAQIALGQALV